MKTRAVIVLALISVFIIVLAFWFGIGWVIGKIIGIDMMDFLMTMSVVWVLFVIGKYVITGKL